MWHDRVSVTLLRFCPARYTTTFRESESNVEKRLFPSFTNQLTYLYKYLQETYEAAATGWMYCIKPLASCTPLQPHPVLIAHPLRARTLRKAFVCALTRHLNCNSTTNQTFSGWALQSRYKTVTTTGPLQYSATNNRTKTVSFIWTNYYYEAVSLSLKRPCVTWERPPVLAASLMYFCESPVKRRIWTDTQ